MPPLTGDDDAMKALRAHSLQIEAIDSATKGSDPTSDESWWWGKGPVTAIERDKTEAWKRYGSILKIKFDLNGKVRTQIDARSPQSLLHITCLHVTRPLDLTLTTDR
jgi:hypothetical protein